MGPVILSGPGVAAGRSRMSATRCPYCETALTPAERQGKRCPACRHELPSPIQAEPSPWASGGSLHAQQGQELGGLVMGPVGTKKPDDWAGVRTGLGLWITGMIITLICQFVGLI